MRILILGISRSGTSSLLKGFGDQGFYQLSEPFNSGINYGTNLDYPISNFNDYTKLCVKCLCKQKPKNLDTDGLSFYKEFIREFDRVIILDRLNKEEHKESYLHMMWRMDNKQSVMLKWTPSDIPQEYKKDFKSDNRFEDLKKEKEEIKLISKKLNIPITYYEDLYGKDRQKSLDIIKSWNININENKLNKYLDPKYKLRQYKENLI